MHFTKDDKRKIGALIKLSISLSQQRKFRRKRSAWKAFKRDYFLGRPGALRILEYVRSTDNNLFD